jgi:predicted AAA+ superfamily ATPase
MMQVHPQIGFLWEGYALEQIIQQLPRPYQPYFYRTHDGAELDLVIIKGTEPYMGIDFKYSTAPSLSKGFYQSVADLKTRKNFVIVPGIQADYPMDKSIRVCDLPTFLSKYLPK